MKTLNEHPIPSPGPLDGADYRIRESLEQIWACESESQTNRASMNLAAAVHDLMKACTMLLERFQNGETEWDSVVRAHTAIVKATNPAGWETPPTTN